VKGQINLTVPHPALGLTYVAGMTAYAGYNAATNAYLFYQEGGFSKIHNNIKSAGSKAWDGFKSVFSAKGYHESSLYTELKDLINSGKSIDALIVSKDPEELRAALLKQDGHGKSLLHWAVHNDNAGVIAKLMDGAQSFPGLLLEMFMVKDNAGSIPLLLALFREKVDATNLLLDKALESAELFEALTVENNSGVSVLEKIISNTMGDLLARIIEKAGNLGKLSAIVNFKNSDGQSILELAKDSGAANIEAQITTLLSQVAQDDPALPITPIAEVLVAPSDALSITDGTLDSNPLYGNEASSTTSLNIMVWTCPIYRIDS